MLTFEVKNLGRVAAAEVQLAPLTIFVGKNNTGKSYLATLVWALARPALLTETGAISRKPTWFSGFVGPLEDDQPRRLELDERAVAAIIKLVERAFNRKSGEILSLVFAYDGFKETKVKLDRSINEGIEFGLEMGAGRPFSNEEDGRQVDFYVKHGNEKRIVYVIREEWLREPWIPDLIFQEMLGNALFGKAWRAYRNETYIPAARTGIMLALPALISQSLGTGKQTEKVGLPRPLSSFLSKMTEGSIARRNQATPVRDRLRKELLRGQISAPRETVSDVRYTPEGMDVALPLYATSSMITELAPFALALTNEAGTHHFIFEEPEAHLHLEAQREMARIIARLVGSGTPVTLTTHSDTFLQQINNLMVLAGHVDRGELVDELGYDIDDLIDSSHVRAYEFCPEADGTRVRPIALADSGFVVPTLNNTLLNLAEETIRLRTVKNG